MYYSELSGPNGTTTTALQSGTAASKKPAEAKTASTPDTDKGAKAEGAKAESPAYTISQSMESLLDTLSGKPPAAGGSGGFSGGSGNAQAMAARAQEAQRILQTVMDQGKGLAGLFGKAIDGMKDDLGRTLGGLGMPSDKINDVVSGFGDHLKDKLKGMDFSKMALDMQQSRSAWSIESRGIELTIQDGDRSVRISFAKSTLDFRRDDQRLQATLNGDRSGSIGFEQATTQVSGKATGMIVRAEGFSEDEIKGVLEKLNGMAAKGGDMSGLGVLKQTKGADGVTHLSLDLSQPVEGLTDGTAKSEPAGAAKSDAAAPVNITA